MLKKIAVKNCLNIVYSFFFAKLAKMDPFPYYADFMIRIKNHLFPVLTYQGVDFYRLYFSRQTPPVPTYTRTDLERLADELEALLPASNQLDRLVEWIQRQHISDANAVLDAIETGIAQAAQRPLSFPAGLSAAAVEAVRECVLQLAARLPAPQKKT